VSEQTKKKVVFIEPTVNQVNVFENYMRLPLLGCMYLGTILHNQGYGVTILNENILSKKIDPFEVHADVFCITSLTVSANRAKIIATQLRRIHPKAKIIMGGIHASLMPEEFTDVADHVVKGEAESIIVALIEGAYTEKIIEAPQVDNLESLPLINYSLLAGYTSLGIIPIMTSRGCPFDCSFCTVTKIFGRRFRMFSARRIVDEVKNALKYFSARNIFFYDDNFTANTRRVHELCDLIQEEKITISWNAQVRSDIAREPELLFKMKKAGCSRFFIGFESINDETLKAMNKSQTRGDIEKAIAVIHEKGINIHGMFIFGEDHDTIESLRATADFAINQHLDTVQFMVLTPFPGTRTYEKIAAEKRFFHNQWDYFDGMHITYRPRTMNAATLQLETNRAYRKFYSLRRVLLEGLKLSFQIFVDALVWDFSRVFRYGIYSMFLKAGGKFLVKEYVRGYDTYIKFLIDADQETAQNDAGVTETNG